MKDTGSRDQTLSMAEDEPFSPMVQFSRAIGQTAKEMARAGTSILKAMSMKVNGKKT